LLTAHRAEKLAPGAAGRVHGGLVVNRDFDVVRMLEGWAVQLGQSSRQQVSRLVMAAKSNSA
jgi:hypothetical protein